MDGGKALNLWATNRRGITGAGCLKKEIKRTEGSHSFIRQPAHR